MFKKTNIIIECELSLVLKEYETIEEKLNEMGIYKYRILSIEDKGETIVDLRAMEMLK